MPIETMTEVITSSVLDQETTAVPTLRVMRLQSPELHQSIAGTLEGSSLLERSLCLPDSLAVYVGESFTAYLGILNVSSNWPIRRLRVSAQLQTPSQRWQLPSRLDQASLTGGIDIEPLSGKDAIVSHLIEEPGQHILRVEVGYMTADGGSKTFRKFYRFQVTAPLEIRQSVRRCGDSCCFVTIDVDHNLHSTENKISTDTPLVISDASFMPANGLEAERILPAVEKRTDSAISLFDNCTVLNKGSSIRYLFRVEAVSPDAILRGISADDVIGKAVFRWRKAMGETGECVSSPVICPPVDTSTVNRSGLSVDLAAAAATQSSRPDRQGLLDRFPITVEPINPPQKLVLNAPQKVQFLVVNHSEQVMSIQWQLRSSLACGRHFQSLGELAPRGGSTVVTGRLLARDTGLIDVDGCVIVDLITGQEWPQPTLFQVFVEDETPVKQ